MHRLIAVLLVLTVGVGIAVSAPKVVSVSAALSAAHTLTPTPLPADALKSPLSPPTDEWLYYDSGTPAYYYPIGSDFWTGVGFDPGVQVTLDEVWAGVYNYTDVNMYLKFSVYDDNGGEPGTEVWSSLDWIEVEPGAWAVTEPTDGIICTGKFYIFIKGQGPWPELGQLLDDDGCQAPAGTQWAYEEGVGFFEVEWNPYPCDIMIRANVTLYDNDLGVTAIERPVYFGEMPMTFKPKAEIKNFGNLAQNNFDVQCQIVTATDAEVYNQTVKVTTELPGGEVRSVEFPDWVNPPVGNYTVTFTTLLDGDQNPVNDAKSNDFPVADELEARWDDIADPANPANAWAFYNGGNGFLNAFPDYWGKVAILKTKVALYPNTWPDPGDNKYRVAIQDDDGADGGPGTVLHASGVLTGTRGAWHEYTLPEPIVVNGGRFYVKYTQVGDYPNCAGLSCDDTRDGPSWSQWYESPPGTYELSDIEDFGIRCVISRVPSYSAGWKEVKPMPAKPSDKDAKDGAWLTALKGNTDAGPVFYVAKGNKTSDFYMYVPSGDSGTWYDKEEIPGDEGGRIKLPSKGCVGVSDGDRYIYMTKGNNTLGFWRYDATLNKWEAMSEVLPGDQNKKVKGGTDLAYVDNGDSDYVYLLKGYKTEFYRYSVAENKWYTLDNAPDVSGSGKYDKGSFLVYDGANYIYAHQAKYYDKTNTADPHHYMFRYDIKGDSWSKTPKRGMPVLCLEGGRENKKKKSGDGAAGVWYAGNIYALKGGNTQGFYKYSPADDNWVQLETVPGNGTSPKKKRVKSGGDIAADGYGAFFALKGNKSRELWRYALASSFGEAPYESQGAVAGLVNAERLSLTLVPNPVASGFALVHFSLPATLPATLTVFDVAGRSVLRQSTIGSRQTTMILDLRGLAAGVYLVRLDADKYLATQKLLVEH
ncbi:MAG: T9SS type A sorting domain-containing protein [candidate division WOR-3 bacterium]